MSERVLHSVNAAGRHWLTVASEPPLQIGPVAPNHCRIGYHLLQALVHGLDELPRGAPVPEELDIHLESGGPAVRVALPLRPGPEDWGSPSSEEADPDRDGSGDGGGDGGGGGGDDSDDDAVLFLTLVAPGRAPHEIDEWIVPLATALGLEAEPAAGEGGYERAMEAARVRAQSALPGVRERFLRRRWFDLGGPRFGFKIGLATTDAGMEWVWVRPRAWPSADRISVTLESEPVAVAGRKRGDRWEIAASEIVDYVIHQPRGGSEGGFTQRIAADYGLIISG